MSCHVMPCRLCAPICTQTAQEGAGAKAQVTVKRAVRTRWTIRLPQPGQKPDLG